MSKTAKLEPGQVIREASEERDPVTGRRLVRLTQSGPWTMVPMYHRRSSFLRDSRHFIAMARRGDRTGLVLFSADTLEGRVVASWPAPRQGALFFDDFRISLVAGQDAVIALHEGTIEWIDLATGQRCTVAEGLRGHRVRGLWPAIDGSYALFVRNPWPEGADGITSLGALYNAYREQMGGIPSEFVRIDLRSGKLDTIHEHPSAGVDHLQPCPRDPNRWLVDLNLPPKFSWLGDDGKTTRCWLLDAGGGGLVQELRPRNANRFQMHSNWNADGTLAFYHGRDAETGAPLGKEGGGHYIGAVTPDGTVAWERVYPDFHYGHVTPDMRNPRAVLLNNGLADGLLLSVDFSDAGDDGPGRTEILCRHGSGVRYGDFSSYPYPEMSPDSRFVAFHQGLPDGTHLFLLELDS